jgi:hypothetical protein
MKRITILLVLVLVGFAKTAKVRAQSPSQPGTVHLATSIDHITVLEFGEPVTQAAVGSSAFNVEWRANKVLIKPLKAGASTDLFVWTASRRFTYELDPPGEAKNMNYAVDNLAPVSKPAPAMPPDAQMAEIADMVLTRALLGADRIDSSNIKDRKGSVVVRVENVFQSTNGLYVRYSITNLTAQTYHVPKPKVSQLSSGRTGVSMLALEKTQLDSGMLRTIRDAKHDPLPVTSSEASKEDLASGEVARGVVVLRQQFTAPAVLEFTFVGAGGRDVTATFVL